jgi:hypothetical protein
MKKKILIKEVDLDNLVKGIINEVDNGQLELDFDSVEDNSVIEMLTERYNEIVEEVKEAISSCPNNCYEKLEDIHDNKIFELWRHVDKVASSDDIIEKFNDLEDFIIDYIELGKEKERIDDELRNSLDNLQNHLYNTTEI